MTSTTVLVQEVTGVSTEGVGTIEVTYEAIRAEMSAAGQETSYDSTLEGDAKARNDESLAKMFEPMLDVRFRMEIEPSGRIRSFDGFEDVFDVLTPEMRAMLEPLFSDDALGRMFEVNVFPEERLSVGNTWERAVEMELPMLGTIELTYENELTGFEERGGDDCVKIDLGGSIELDADGSSAGFKISLDDGDISGGMWVARDSGYIIESTVTTFFALGMDMGTEMSMDMSQRTTVRMLRIGEDDPAFD